MAQLELHDYLTYASRDEDYGTARMRDEDWWFQTDVERSDSSDERV